MIKLYDSEDGQFYLTLCGRNGHPILTSETYPTRQHLDRAVKSVINITQPVHPQELKIKDLTKQSKKK